MLFWISYIFFSLIICYLFSRLLPNRLKVEILLISFVFLVTPSLIEISSNSLAPAISVFLFDLMLENNFSTRSLKPLLISLPITSIFSVAVYFFRRKFS